MKTTYDLKSFLIGVLLTVLIAFTLEIYARHLMVNGPVIFLDGKVEIW